MKRIIFIICILIAIVGNGIYLWADNNVQQVQPVAAADTLSAAKLKQLNAQSDSLQKLIALQGHKLNTIYRGVSPEVQEQMDNREDSLYLDLKSQHTRVLLEIKELKKISILNFIRQTPIKQTPVKK